MSKYQIIELTDKTKALKQNKDVLSLKDGASFFCVYFGKGLYFTRKEESELGDKNEAEKSIIGA
ncbi:MAG: hypothetical protein A2Z72_04900 [Omnitrophica bacterium RBG_13_46_9]|nr:MAG: hypothetical protein A2Z72_04900 [Omnitrophica bacterium RBG_13_46_9]